MSNIEKTKDGLVEKFTGRKIESPLDDELNSVRFEKDILLSIESKLSESSNREQKIIESPQVINETLKEILPKFIDKFETDWLSLLQ